ncbi:FecR domain-containing protein [Thiomicrorhabdus sp.]|uniref:FecR domain-containing protein n=1 Tax=Thiomicrorhabdus sp. TaxID=2039724 RepID=UPI002AA6A3EC|nr:FecR domain-containing protein [Thiomicrorhabdus sp.]
MKKIVFIIAFLVTTEAFASVGKVTALNGSATIERSYQEINAYIGLPIKQEDTVITRDETQMQMIFNDNTVITLGKNTIFRVSNFSFNQTEKTQVEFSLTKGFMKSVTGQIGKLNPTHFKVKTANATIGVRGTTFTLEVNDRFTQLTTLKGATYYQDNATQKIYEVPKNHTLIFNHKTGNVEIRAINNDFAFNIVDTNQDISLPDQRLTEADEVNQNSLQNSTMSKKSYDKVTVSSATYSEYGYWENTSTNVVSDVWADAIAGESETSTSQINNYITNGSTANYSGGVVAFDNNQQGTGTIQLNVNFGASSNATTGIIDYTVAGNHWQSTFNGNVSPTGIDVQNFTAVSSDISSITGSLSGKFYGPNAEELAGTFELTGQDTGVTRTSIGSYNALGSVTP